MNKFFDFFFTDRVYRWRTYLISGTIAVSYASLNLVLHRNEKEVSLESSILLCLLIILSVLYYVFKRPSAVDALDETSPAKQIRLRRPLVTLIASAGIVLLGATQIRNLPNIQAAVLNARLDQIVGHIQTVQAAGEFQSLRPYQNVQSIVDAAFKDRVPIDQSRLLNAEKAIEATANQPGMAQETKRLAFATAVQLNGLAAVRTLETNVEPQPMTAFPINSVLLLENGKWNLRGVPTVISGGGTIVIRNSTVVFDRVDFRARAPFHQFLMIENSTVLVRDATLENVEQVLDGVTWVNVQFQKSRIQLDKGGAFTLVNVSFKDCDVQLLLFDPRVSDLAEKITQAHGQPITYVYDGRAGSAPKPE